MNKPEHFFKGDDQEATEHELKGVAYTGLGLIFLLSATIAAVLVVLL